MSDALIAYQQLVTHPGWLQLTAAMRQYWQRTVLDQLAHATDDRDDVVALNKLRQVVAARSAVEQVLAYPEQQIRILAGAQAPVIGGSPSRRGPV